MKKFISILFTSFMLASALTATNINGQIMTSEESATISAGVYLTWDTNPEWNKFIGFSRGVPNPPNWYDNPDTFNGNVENLFEDSTIILKTDVNSENQTEIFGYYDSDSDSTQQPLYLWYFSNNGRIRPGEYTKINASISKMTSWQYKDGLDFTMKFTKEDNTEGASTKEISTKGTSKDYIYDGYGTRDWGSGGFDSDDFAYWKIEITTDNLPEGVPAGASFTGSVTVEIQGEA